MFEALNGKQLSISMNPLDQILIVKYKTGSGDNHPFMLLSSTRGKDLESPPLPKEPDPSDLKFQETFSL